MVLRLSSATERTMVERVARLIEEPRWQNPNRNEARVIAEATARKLVTELGAVIGTARIRQTAPATLEV